MRIWLTVAVLVGACGGGRGGADDGQGPGEGLVETDLADCTTPEVIAVIACARCGDAIEEGGECDLTRAPVSTCLDFAELAVDYVRYDQDGFFCEANADIRFAPVEAQIAELARLHDEVQACAEGPADWPVDPAAYDCPAE